MLIRNISRSFRSIIVVALTMGFCGYSHVSSAAEKMELSAKIQKELQEAVLQKARLHQRPNAAAVDNALVQIRVRRLTESVASIPQNELNDDLADWISRSLLSLVNDYSMFSEDSEWSSRQFNLTLIQANKRFPGLTKNNGDELLKRRQILTTAGMQYQRSVRSFLVKKLASAKSLRISSRYFGYSAAPPGAFHAGAWKAGVKIGPANRFQSVFDYREDKAKSGNLTQAFIAEIKGDLDTHQWMSEQNLGNILTLAYEEGDPKVALEWKGFDEVRPEVERLSKLYMPNRNGEVSVHLDSLSEFLWSIQTLRWNENREIPKRVGDNRTVLFNNSVTVTHSWTSLMVAKTPARLFNYLGEERGESSLK